MRLDDVLAFKKNKMLPFDEIQNISNL